MSDEIVLYTNPMSRGRTARWMLEEVGAPYRAEVLEFDGSMKSPDYLAINPLGKVPAIRHRGQTVTEVAAICAYLADAFPTAGLAPAPSSPERGGYYRWLFFAAPLETAMMNAALGVELKPDMRRAVGYAALATMLDVLETRLNETMFLSGDAFGAADVNMSSLLGWGMMAGMIEKRDTFTTYCARFQDRPAFARAQAKDGAFPPSAA